MEHIDLYTIGFTKKSAHTFFDLLNQEKISRLIDVRLNNVSQLAGFAKKDDLKYFLRELCNIEYHHLPELAPTQEILDAYKKHKGPWDKYEKDFLELMYKRNIEKHLDKNFINEGCLLCSEDKPHFCHRRLVAEYLQRTWDTELTIKHIF